MAACLITISRNNFSIYAEQIIEIERLSFSCPWSLRAFEEELKKPISNLWAFEKDKTLFAYICFWMFDNEIQVLNLAVHPKMRGRHLGQNLLTRMIDTGISKGLKNVWLEVRPSNLIALGLYTKFGFHEVNRRRQYYNESNEDAIIMALDLSKERNPRPVPD